MSVRQMHEVKTKWKMNSNFLIHLYAQRNQLVVVGHFVPTDGIHCLISEVILPTRSIVYPFSKVFPISF